MGRVPKYRRHSTRDFAFVEHRGRRIRLPGRHNSPESRSAYTRILRQIIRAEEREEIPVIDLTVGHLVRAYLDWAVDYYSGNKEYVQLCYAAGPLVHLHADTWVDEFGPTALKEVRQVMVDGSWANKSVAMDDERREVPRAWSRTHTNQQINRIRRMFRWGVENEMVPATVLEALKAVAPLRKGRTTAAEPTPVEPVPPKHVDAILPHVSPTVAAMVRLQQITGMRSANLCQMRLCEIDQSAAVWLYCPDAHKGAWRDAALVIPLGPQAQALLAPFLNRDEKAYVFSPREALAWWRAHRPPEHKPNRKTPIYPSELKAREAAKAARRRKRTSQRIRDHYDPDSYRRAILYGLEKANKNRKQKIPAWHPHQLRHTVATTVRKRYGLEGSRVYLGHAHAETTQIYAQRDLELALRIASDIG